MPISVVNAGSVGDSVVQGFRNLIINGAMQVAQRGTSFTSQTGVAYHIDRFETQAYNVGTAQYKAEQSTEAPDGFYHSLKYSCTTADTSQDANNQFYIQQQIEAQNIYHLKFYEANPDSVTISFYVRSNTTGSYGMTLKLSDNNSSDSNVGTRIYPTTFSISSADTWQRITKTITLDSSTSEVRSTGNNFGMALVIWLAAGSSRQGATADAWAGNGNATTTIDADDFLGSTSNNFHLTGVQLEVGSQATPFEHEDFATTLRKCQRYFEKTYPYASPIGTAGVYNTEWPLGAVGMDGASGQRYHTAQWKVEKRLNCTMVIYDYAGTSGKVSTVSGAGVITNNRAAALVFAGETIFGAGPANGAYGGVLYHATGDAEL